MEKHPEIFIRDCVFHEQVRLGNLQNSPGIIFVSCKFKKGICGRDARLGKCLKLVDCDVEPIDKQANDIALDLDNAHIEGELLLYNCRLGGRFFAPGLQAKSHVRLRGCHIAAASSDIGEHLRLDEIGSAEIDDLLKRQGWKASASFRATPAISLNGADIDGDLEVTAASIERKATSTAAEALLIGNDQIPDLLPFKRLFQVFNWLSRPDQAFVVNASPSVIVGGISAVGVTVHGHICLFGALCQGSVDFRNSHCSQDLLLYCNEVSFVESPHFRTTSWFALHNATLESDLNARGSKIEGALYLAGSQVKGSLFLVDAEIKGDVVLYNATIEGRVDVGGLRTSGDLNCNFATLGGLWAIPSILGTLEVRLRSKHSLEVDRDLALSGANIRSVELRGITVKGRIRILTGKFGRVLLRMGVEPSREHKGKFRPKSCRAGSVMISAIEIDESLDVSGLQVRLSGESLAWTRLTDQDEGFVLEQSKIGRDLKFFRPDMRRELESRLNWTDKVWENVKKYFRGVVTRERAVFPWEDQKGKPFGSSFWGGLKLRANQIGGELDLRDVHVNGPIHLNDTTVGLDLRMDGLLEEEDIDIGAQHSMQTTCMHLNAEKLQCGGDIDFTGLRVLRNMKMLPDEVPRLADQKRGVLLAHEANVKGQIFFLPREKEKKKLREIELATNRLQLTELIRDQAENPKLKKKLKTLTQEVARGERELGLTQLDPIEKDNEFVSGYALIEGCGSQEQPSLDLTAVQAIHLLLTGHNVPLRQAKVSLERGHFSRLEIVDPPPGPIDLSKTTVDRWVFGDKDEPVAKDYISVLEQMDPFDRSTWINVETTLRNQAQESEANSVYRGMRWEARKAKKNPQKLIERFGRAHSHGFGRKGMWLALLVLPLLILALALLHVPLAIIVGLSLFGVVILFVIDKDALYGNVLGYGTWAWLPMVLSLFLFLPLSLFIFSRSQYVRASSELLEVLKEDKAKKRLNLETSPNDLGNVWSWPDTLALTLRYQVPVIPNITHTRWEAGGKTVTEIPLLDITAEQYALFLIAYHWVAWPLFLIWLAAIVVRGRRS